jgi:hypothetical protein
MGGKKKKCEIDGCDTLTYGKMCLVHSREKRKKFNTTYDLQRNFHLQKKYGISLDEFWDYWIVFKGKCSICQNDLKLPERRQGQSLDVVAVDHDHNTGKIRGLLCNGCNKGLGLFKDSPQLLESAINYLKK